ncbi:MAG TPA: YHS domain-containing protein [Ignavibacteriaceae bacterium]
MLKTIVINFFIITIFSVLISAQENPEKSNEETQSTTEMKSEQTVDSTAATEELVIWNKVCPVKGNPIEDDTPTVEYNGKLYGFCCPGCDTKFAKNPEKYAKNLSEDGTKFIGRK